MVEPWHWRAIPLEGRTGSQIFESLFYAPGSVGTLLESPYPTPPDYPHLSRYSICAGAPRQGKLWTPPLGDILPFLKGLLNSSPPPSPCPHLPFSGGWLGWLSYDLAREIENIPAINPDTLPFPVAYWYEPLDFAVLDHAGQILWLAVSNVKDLDYYQNLLEAHTGAKLSPPLAPSLLDGNQLRFCTDKDDYEEAVRKALRYIKAGDVFQTNLSLRFQAATTADGWEIYKRLQRINPSPFASYWQTPAGIVISCSPERLVQLWAHKAQTRPIAGTRARGGDADTDARLAGDLLANVKERAEHIMLVDLERNDLGKVCQWGSIAVDELLTIERYSHVMHLVSNVRGTLKPQYDGVDLIRAMFPGGTITGCPKVRCMEIIEELEPLRRSLFYGSCGYIDTRGNLDLNILIRTLLLTPANGFYNVWGQVGAGIVADSDPNKEWRESLQKGQAQLTALGLIDNVI
ncbi:MAG: Isochorismate synthase MenF [Chroococcopsis gigantea SAG 12.99]|jgi:para-aminobenzoate synthetase component 1|nr:anthranilate synthase component I [Chlorogloea purpurea SAG 13.99]MDV3000761.1 Isochorismate synthase MenF [Chroococcopsis gigantea SAG 12.99]